MTLIADGELSPRLPAGSGPWLYWASNAFDEPKTLRRINLASGPTAETFAVLDESSYVTAVDVDVAGTYWSLGLSGPLLYAGH